MPEEPCSYSLMNAADITSCLDVLQEYDNRHVVLAGEFLVLHLHGGLLCHLLRLVPHLKIVPESTFHEPLVSVVGGIGKPVVYWSDTCKATILR